MRRQLRITLTLLTLVIVALGVVRLVVNGLATPRVRSELEKLYGGPVTLGQAELGWAGSALRDLALFEPDDAGGEPWLKADRVHLDLTLSQLLRGDAQPHNVRVDGATVTLRFDADGNLLTRWPTRPDAPADFDLPRLDLRDSLLRLKRADGTELAVAVGGATLDKDGDKLRLRGTVDQEQWGPWTVDGTVTKGAFDITLKSKGDVHVTQAMLDRLPFVPGYVWKEMQAEGDTPVTVRLRHDPADPGLRYRVDLAPHRTKVRVSALDWDASDAAGKLVIEDGLITLRGLSAKSSGGTIAGDGDLDFRQAVTNFDFPALAAKDVRLDQLPRGWHIPPELEGKVSAQGQLRLEIDKGKLRTTAQGRGEVRDARFAGQPLDEPVRLTLRKGTPEAPDAAALEIEARTGALDLAAVLARLDIRPPLPVTGLLGFRGRLVLPLDTLTDLRTHRGRASVEVTQARVGTTPIDRVTAELFLKDGWLRVPTLQAQGGGVNAAGALEVAVAPAGDVDLHVVLEGVDLATLAPLLNLGEPMRGEAAGRLTARVHVERWHNLDAWSGSADLRVRHAAVGDLCVRAAWARAVLRDGVLHLHEARALVEDGTLTAAAQIRLTEPFPFDARLDVNQADLTLARLLPVAWRPAVPVGGRLSGTAHAAGTLRPWLAAADGITTIDDLQYQKYVIPAISATWAADADALTLPVVTAALAKGTVAGSACVPLRPDQTGRIDLQMKDIDAAVLAKEFDLPVALGGKVQGKLAATISAGSADRRQTKAKLELTNGSLRVERVPVEKLEATVTWQTPALEYRVEGRLLGGRALVQGKLEAGDKVVGEGRLILDELRLDRLSDAWRLTESAAKLHGVVEVNLPFHHAGADDPLLGAGKFQVTNLRYGDRELGGDLRGEVRLTPDQFALRDLSGAFAGGTLRGSLGWPWKQPQRRYFNVTIDNAEASRLLSPWPDAAALVQGPVRLNVRGKLEGEWHGTAEALLQRGKVAGVEVAEWRLPAAWSFAPAQSRGKIEVRGSDAHLAGGRVTGDATVSWDSAIRLSGKLQFANLEVGPLLRGQVENPQFNGGKLTGKFDFAADDFRGPDSLNGVFEAKLAQTKSPDVPVFKQVLVLTGLAPSTTFQKGEVRAFLTGEVIRLEKLAVETGAVQLYANGTATTTGRLNLDVTANTGKTGITAAILGKLGVPVPLVGDLGPGPLRLLRQLFSARLVHLQVTGTVRAPQVRVAPLPLLTQEALRFFVGGFVGGP